MFNNKKKQKGAAAIEYAILAAAMSLILIDAVGGDGKITAALKDTYTTIETQLGSITKSDSEN
ncbi:Flp family type IVb pilin [Vibrio sp. Of7-15]|uniref:Flp family type IVb pilin n=1 Tax=Vibrio sp. Of7-15 TaxID=2724879 RepID=UPI001EF1C63E|nr:Flp family type IVb pilin [Vibrio sp. Of7-15]MCG7496158.1 Flp family type IVb pilin [Vibrio sp. Of7-15]